MTKIYKYQVEDELKNLNDIGIDYFRKYLDKASSKYNKIVLFKNKDISSYYCTKCQKWHFVEAKKVNKLKRKDYLTCSSCNTKLEIIYSHNIIEDFIDYFTVIESNVRDELIFRVFYYKKEYHKKTGTFDEYFYEVSRINLDRDIAMKNNTYSNMRYIYHSLTTKGWSRDRSNFFTVYPYSNVVTQPAYIKRIINRNEKYKYSCLDLAAKYKIDVLSFFKLISDYPKTEFLIKLKCTNLLLDICNKSMLRKLGYSLTSIFNNIDKTGINLLRKYNLSLKEIKIYLDTKIYKYELLKKAAIINFDRSIKNNLMLDLKDNYREEKIINYLYSKGYIVNSVQDKINIINYKDYVSWCVLLGKNMSDKKIMYPQKFNEAHDTVYKEFKAYENKIYDKEIFEFSKELEKYDFNNKKFIIRPARSQEELINESDKLNHCVSSYAEKVAKRKTSIFFIRTNKEPSVPYVTVELKENKVIQVRGYKNNTTEPLAENVKNFVRKWTKKYNLTLNLWEV